MRPVGIHHVSINVSDVAAALAFYTEVLGLEQRTDRPEFGIGGHWLNAGGQQVHLIDMAMPDQRGQHFALQVADLDAVVAELRARGITVGEPMSTGVGRQCNLHDPCGNLIELNEPNRV
jgi:catechol 2,3-dioxygenase-like lactoylglutathione lyase family enzyme